MKSLIVALLVTTSAPVWAHMQEVEPDAVVMTEESPATASTPVSPPASPEIDQMMAIFSKMFDTSKLPAPDPARLKLAEVTASKLLADGTYVRIFNDMMGGMLLPLFDAMPGMSDAQIASKTGAATETVAALSPENKEAVTLIIDPNFKKRGEQVMSIISPMIKEVMTELEPAMRKGLSRAYARKFSVAELNSINSFFATPAGASYAGESLALQADPEVLQATFKAIPAIITKMMGDQGKMKARFDALPKERKLSEMSDAELQKLGGLLGMSVQSLKDYEQANPAWTDSLPECARDFDESDCSVADLAVRDAAVAAATDSSMEMDSSLADQEKLRAAWSKTDRKAVEKAEAAQAALWNQHEQIDAKIADAELNVLSAIENAKRNAGQPVDSDQNGPNETADPVI